MSRRRVSYALAGIGLAIGMAGALIGIFWGKLWPNAATPALSPGVSIQRSSNPRMQAELQSAIASAPARAMSSPGLAAATGGVHVKIHSTKPQEMLFPIPQLVDAQVPLCFFVNITPATGVIDCQLQARDGGNYMMRVLLEGGERGVRIAWSSIVLLAARAPEPGTAPIDSYRTASPCVQADADEVTRLAASLWPATGRVTDFAANIQRHVRESTRREQPKSLDALGIVESGENSICTANANLAAALMRSRGIACRTVAAIPTSAQRMEMHRIVEFHESGQWASFDPSSVYTDIPPKPWQYIIMARTTIGDEELAMKPRMGAMVGCPYGHEAELLSPGISLSGQDFFWSQAKLLAEFEATDRSVRLAADAWAQYLKTGALAPSQLKAASAKTTDAFEAALRGE